MIKIGTIVRYKGGMLPWSQEVSPEDNRLGRVVDPSQVETSRYFMGQWDIDLCLEWLDAKEGSSIRERYCVTSSKRVEVVDNEKG